MCRRGTIALIFEVSIRRVDTETLILLILDNLYFPNYIFSISYMYNSAELNEFRYAQLQSSILNKTPPSQLPPNTKFNLKAKFSTIEHGLNAIQ